MINKIVHYVWIGGKPISAEVKKVMNNNDQILGNEWTHKIWTEKDFDIQANPYTKYWYKKKQWAYVSNYIKTYAVFKEGGFYLDTDIALHKSLDELLKHEYVASRTNVVWNALSIFGAIENHPITKRVMELAENRNMIGKIPKIIFTHLHTYAIDQFAHPTLVNRDFITDEIAILTEDKLQINLKNGKSIAIYEHDKDWTGTSELAIPKYYRKVKFYKNLTNRKLNREIRIRKRVFNKIKKLTKS